MSRTGPPARPPATSGSWMRYHRTRPRRWAEKETSSLTWSTSRPSSLVALFVEELERRLAGHYHATKAQFCFRRITVLVPKHVCLILMRHNDELQVLQGIMMKEVNHPGNQDLTIKMDLRFFHLRFFAPEACLEAACSSLENEAKTLEQEAHPAFDKLTSKIKTLNLECVWQIKSCLVAITGLNWSSYWMAMKTWLRCI